jgi:predicted lipoprotein
MKIARRLGAAALSAVTLGFAAPAAAVGIASSDFQALNAAIVEDYVLPRYAAFAQAAAVLEVSLMQACADGRAEAAESAGAYHSAMDAWMAVQHLRFGPSELFLRAERTEFWPDKRGTVRRHLAQMLSDRDEHALEADVFANGSVAVQGFPALERLLFDSEANDWATPFTCQLTCAIGRNLGSIATGMLNDWRGGEAAYARTMESAGEGGNDRYFDAKEASLEFAKSLRGALLLVGDYKLGRPLGGAPDEARATRAESWRSARSLRNVAVNLKAAQALYEVGGDASFSAITRAQPKGAELDEVIRAAFGRLITAIEAQPDSLVTALEAPDGWAQLNAIRTETKQLLELLGGPLSEVLDLPMGFNSYDGD